MKFFCYVGKKFIEFVTPHDTFQEGKSKAGGGKKSNGAILFIIDSNDLKIRFTNGLAGSPPPLALPLSYYDFNYRQRATTHSIEVYLSTNIVLEKIPAY